MSRQPDKKCPHCDNILQRIYIRACRDGKYRYEPIGYMCPFCAEDMIALDRGWRKTDVKGG